MVRKAILTGALCSAVLLAFAIFAVSRDTPIMSIPSEVQAAYPDASPEVQQIASAIKAGKPLDSTMLNNIGVDALNAFYGPPNGPSSFLLNDTLLHQNFPAAKALVKAGVNVRYANDLMIFNALDMKQGRLLVPFADYSPGIPFLRLYLENGGNPNAQYQGDKSGRLALLHGSDNLEGLLVLLAHGADPWLEAITPQGTTARSFYDSLSFSSSGIVSGEIMFRIANAGYFEVQRVDQIQIIYDDFERSLLAKSGSTRTEDLNAVWRRQTILDAIIATSGWAPPPRLALLLEQRVSDAHGGWHLRPDQLHSCEEFQDPTISTGKLIWTHADPIPRPRPAE